MLTAFTGVFQRWIRESRGKLVPGFGELMVGSIAQGCAARSIMTTAATRALPMIVRGVV